MALKDTTKQIQKAVGTTADGIYGKNTRYHLYKKITNFILENL